MKKIMMTAAIASLLALSACQDDATIASANLVKAADNFEINRRLVFVNGITGRYELEIEGKCSMDLNANATAYNVICKVGSSAFKRHTLVLADNVFAVVEQLEPVEASAYHYRVTFKPQQILPDIDFRGDAKEAVTNRN